jgi:hypothetical protein
VTDLKQFRERVIGRDLRARIPRLLGPVRGIFSACIAAGQNRTAAADLKALCFSISHSFQESFAPQLSHFCGSAPGAPIAEREPDLIKSRRLLMCIGKNGLMAQAHVLG